jgi:NADH-quinone oxidoreductase subunit G
LTIDWTPALGSVKGYQSIEFDALPNGYTNSGEEQRGYILKNPGKRASKDMPERFDEKMAMEGEIVYRCNPQRQFNDFSDKAHQIFEEFALYASEERASALGGKVKIDFGAGSIECKVLVDDKMEGDIVKLPDFKSAKDIYTLFGRDRYKKVTIRKV